MLRIPPAPGFVRRPGGGVFYGWWLVAIAAFIAVVAGSEIRQSFFAQYFFTLLRYDTLYTYSGWPYILHNAVVVTGSMLPPFVGIAVDRWGSRRLMLIGLPLVGVGFVVGGLSSRVAVVGIAFLPVYVGSALGGYLPAVAAVNHWFRRRRAMAIAILLFVVAVAGALAKLIPEPVGFLPDTFGKQALLATGLVALAIALPLVFLVRNRPEDYGQHPDGTEPEDDEPVPEYSVREAVRNREFWMFALAAACLSAAGEVVAGARLQLVEWRDVQPFPADEIDTVRMMAHILFILVGGYLGDRVPLRRALLWFALLQAAAIAVSLAANGIGFFFLAAVILGMGTGGLQPLLLAALGAHYGRYRFATIFGIYLIVSGELSSAAFSSPFLLNQLFHSSMPPVVASAVFTAIGVAAYLLVREPCPSPSQARVASGVQEDS